MNHVNGAKISGNASMKVKEIRRLLLTCTVKRYLQRIKKAYSQACTKHFAAYKPRERERKRERERERER